MLMAFTYVPKQALRGCLANIRTVNNYRLWGAESTLAMMDLVGDKQLRAQCVNKNRENCYELFITILDCQYAISLKDALVNKGLAVCEKYVGEKVSLN